MNNANSQPRALWLAALLAFIRERARDALAA